jgi:hypothetical protein
MTPNSAISRAMTWWRRTNPLTRFLAWFFVAASVVLPLFLIVGTGGRTALHSIRHVLIWKIYDDSWMPARAALDYLASHHDQQLYTVLRIEQIKFQYPPVSLLFFKPFFALPKFTADPNFWINLASLIVFVVAIALIVTTFSRVLAEKAPAWAPAQSGEALLLSAIIVGFCVTFLPLIAAPDWGQIQTWIDAAFAGAVLAWFKDRKALAGILIGLTIAFKPQLGLLLVWGALRREWRFAGALFFTALVLGIVSLATYGLALHLNYLEDLNYLSRHGESYWWNQSVMGLLQRLQFYGPNTEAESAAASIAHTDFLPPYNLLAYGGSVLTSGIMLLAAFFWRSREHQGAPLVDFLIAALTFTIASPIAWVYHYGIVAPVFAVALPVTLAAKELGPRRFFWLGLAFVLLSTPFDVTQKLAHTRLNFLESTFLFGALLLLWHLYRLRRVEAARGAAGSAGVMPSGAFTLAR